MLTGTQQTQTFALKSILKQWEVYLTKKMVLGKLKTSPQFKTACLNHMKSLFNIDNSFDSLKGRECYNSIVGALSGAGVVDSSFLKEIYTKKQSELLASRGQTISDIHIV